MPEITMWADSIGVWHVRVPSDLPVSHRVALAESALRQEIQPREPHADSSVWRYPTRVPELDTADTKVYRESYPTED